MNSGKVAILTSLFLCYGCVGLGPPPCYYYRYKRSQLESLPPPLTQNTEVTLKWEEEGVA